MSNLAKEEEILLREYAEAGQLCRSYEQLSRTGILIFVVFSTAIVALLHQDAASPTMKITLEVIGVIFSVITLNVLVRVGILYKTYIDRAREIEDNLGMDLYKRWDNAVKGSMTIRNKPAMLILVVAFGLYFFGALVLEIYPLITG